MSLETWELLSYVVTVVGLPIAIIVFLFEQRKERENEEEEDYKLQSGNYQDFLEVALDYPDLGIYSIHGVRALNDEKRERKSIIFSILRSLFERAYLLMYEDKMSCKQSRRGDSWNGYL